jgi:hypothetical protein
LIVPPPDAAGAELDELLADGALELELELELLLEPQAATPSDAATARATAPKRLFLITSPCLWMWSQFSVAQRVELLTS